MIDFSFPSDWLQFEVHVEFPSSSLHSIIQLELATLEKIMVVIHMYSSDLGKYSPESQLFEEKLKIIANKMS